jgi:hypothetical protein
MRKAESQFDELRTDNLIIQRLAVRAIILESLVHYVPSLYSTFIMSNHIHDVIIHSADEHFTAYQITLIIGKHPLRWLRVPNQAMTYQGLAVLFSPVSQLIAIGEIKTIHLRMIFLALHTVLGNHLVKLFLHYFLTCWVLSVCQRSINGCTHQEILTHSLLECWDCLIAFLGKSCRSKHQAQCKSRYFLHV